ncbi:hypothetical protein Tco_1325449, partial [Tanacetum coccineum]
MNIMTSRPRTRVSVQAPFGASTDAAIRNQGASIKALEIQIWQMSKVLQERGSGILPGSTDFVVLDMPEDIKVPLILEIPFLSTAHAKIDVFKKKIALRANGEALILNRSLEPTYRDYIELNDLNEPLELRRNQVEDLGPTIKDGEAIDKPMVSIVKTRNDDEEIEVVENMDAFRDQDMGEVIVGKPFCKASYVEARRLITIHNGNDNVTYQMARSHLRFKHLTNKQCNKIWPLLKASARDKLNGISHPYPKLKIFYKGVLDLGPEYTRDAKIVECLIRGH